MPESFDQAAKPCQQPLVSVIIAAYNAASFIATSIESALRQSYPNIEVMVANDGSTDGTGDIVRRFAAEGRPVRLIEMPGNQGVSAARNRAIAAATGEWIAILDADDRFAPERIEALVRLALLTGADMVADNLALREFETDNPLGAGFPEAWLNRTEDASLEFMLERDLPGLYRREIGFIKPLIRRRFLVDHQITYATDIWAGEDFLLYIECLLRGARLRFLNEELYIYALRRNSASYQRRANLELVKVNGKLMELVGSQRPAAWRLLEFRAMLLKYEIFKWHCEELRWGAALRCACGIPVRYMLGKMSHAVLRRLGVSTGNATDSAFRRLRLS